MTEQASEQSIFLHAIGLASPASRAAYLDEICRDNPMLRSEIDALLAAHDRLGSDSGQKPADNTKSSPGAEHIGAVVSGRYKLLEVIGEGGMGTVYMAQQTEPVKRLVALKLIKSGMDSRQVIARFEAERQALALMDHPNIARVLDAGTSNDESGGVSAGRPYFVMELVKGIPLTKYCDEHRLTPRQRLELFIPVCQAIQHAHQKGIIHRDIKPSNVLVAQYDGKPVPKVIDFGVAKATGQQLTDQTLVTGFGAIVGTLEYMSPEQAELNQLDIDTRSDIYSLGVLLYELLTGTTPLEKKQLRRVAFDEMLRIIREEEPPRPSTRLSDSRDSLPSISAQRQMEPAKLTKLVRGELDWIVMKSLEKDRSRRYETANGLARDIQHYLSDEPVEACPPSSAYRLRKFARKHRTGLTTAAAFLVLLSAGTTLATWEAMRATRAESLAVQAAAAEKQAADKERQAAALALARLKEIEKANGLLESIFIGVNPLAMAKGGPSLIVEQIKNRLLAVADQLDSDSIGDPLTVARMQNFLGHTLGSLDESAKAIELYQKAWQTRAKLLGPDHLDTLMSMGNVAHGYKAAGKLDLALPIFEEALKLTKAKFGPNHPETFISMNDLAGCYRLAGKLDLALPIFEETLKLRKSKLGSDNPLTLTSMRNLADGYRSAGKLDLALPLYEDALKLMEGKLGRDHLLTLGCMSSMALGYQAAGKLDLALPLFEETLKLTEAKLGPDHSETVGCKGNLAIAYLECQQIDKALPPIEEVVSRQRKRLGADSRAFAGLLAKFGLALLDARQFPHAEKLLQQCLAIREKQEPELWTTFSTQSMLGGSLLGQKKFAEAEPLLLKGYEGMKQREKTIPPLDSIHTAEALDRLIGLSAATNKPDEEKKWRAERAKYPDPK
jgi:eukaryotic-like serine/threonine-protein kinase